MALRFSITDDLRWFVHKLGVEASTVSKRLTPDTYGYIIQKATELVDEKLKLDEVADHFAKILSKSSLTNCQTVKLLQGAYKNFIFPYFEAGAEDLAMVVAQLRKDQRSFHLQFLDLLIVKMEVGDREFFFDFVRTVLKLPVLPPAKRRGLARAAKSSIMGTTSFQYLLKLIDSNDSNLKILKVKDKLGQKPSPRDLMFILTCLKYNKTVEVLHIQNLGHSFTDDVMIETIAMLRRNKNIWAVNIGENEHVSQDMWEEFAAALPETNICFLYAGSECSVHGKLKQAMRDAARVNFRRICNKTWWEDHKETTKKVQSMWWNPTSSKYFV